MDGPERSAEAILVDTGKAVRRRALRRIPLLQMAGAAGVFAYLQEVYPASRAFRTPWLNDGAFLALTLVLLTPIVLWWTHAEYVRTNSWALEGRRPTPEERHKVLVEPFRMAMRPYLLWVLGSLAIAAVILARQTFSVSQTFDLVQVMLIGGVGTCAISYLVLEQTFRPLFALALAGEAADRPASLGVRPRLLLAWGVGSGVPLLGLALSPMRTAGTSISAVAALGWVGFVGGLFAILVSSNGLAEPLDELRRALARVAGGDLSVDLEVDDGGEIGQVQAGFNRMVRGLRERAELHDLFSRHVGQEVADHALASGAPGLGGEARRASVIFVDLKGSTAMAEVLPPGEVVATLNAFFTAVVETVQDEGGWVNKFEGDGALCIFGVPGFQPDHEARALRAARALHERLLEVRADHPGLDAGIGVSSGTVVAGNVGTEVRYEYTVIGRAVNEAARLTDLAKRRPSRVLASSASVRSAGPEREHWIERGTVGLRGQQQPTLIFEPRSRAFAEVADA